jgi:hypothetical protein
MDFMVLWKTLGCEAWKTSREDDKTRVTGLGPEVEAAAE